MRVLLLCRIPSDGGISTKTIELAYFLGSRGAVTRTLIYKHTPKHPYLSRIDHKIFKRFLPSSFAKEVREFKPDVILLAYSSQMGLNLKLNSSKVPIIPVIHGQGLRFYSHSPSKRKVLRKMAGTVLKGFPHVIVLNKDLRKEVGSLGVKSSKISILPNGIDTERFKPLGIKKRSDLIFAGSLYEEKRLDTLLEALILLKEKGVDPSIQVLGDGPKLEDWKKLARSLRVKADFRGWRTDMAKAYSSSRLFVLSSDSEEFPSAPLEALACGVPVICTKVGALPEILRHDHNAVLVEPDDPQKLASAIEKLLNDERKQKKLSRNGLNLVKKQYSWDVVVGDYLDLLRKISKRY